MQKTPDVLCRREKLESLTRLGSSLLNCRSICGIVATMDTMIIETITRIRVLKYVYPEKIKVINAREFF